MKEIVYIKAEVVRRESGSVYVRILNGYGDPEIMVVDDPERVVPDCEDAPLVGK